MLDTKLLARPSLARTARSKTVPGPITRSRSGLFGLALAAAFLLAGCKTSILNPQGPVGAAEKTLIINSAAIMLAIIGPIILATLGFAWWYRASNDKAKYRPDWAYSGRIELAVWAVPLLTIAFLGGIEVLASYRLDPAKPLVSKNKALEVQVVSLDWKWLFIYPDQGVASVNQLVVPVGTPVHFTLTSASVWNSFFVPQLGSAIYTMGGMATQLYLQADREDTFHGLSTHFSGDGFSDMHFDMRSVSDGAFNDWIASARGTGPVLDEAAYGELAKQSIAPAPSTYRSVSSDLFQHVVMRALPPGPGPHAGAAPDVSPIGGK